MTHLDSDDYDTSDEEPDFGDISRYSDSVQRNFLKGLAESHEAIRDDFEINNTDPATFISLSADDLIADYKHLSEMADTDLVNSTEYHPLFSSLEKCVLRDIKRNHIAKAILAAADEKLFEKYFAPWRRQYRSFWRANRAITRAIVNYYPALNGESEYLGCTDFGYSINSIIRKARSMSQKAYPDFVTARKVISTLVNAWKGETRDGFLFVIESAKRAEVRFRSCAHISKPTNIIADLITEFQPEGDRMIRNWHALRPIDRKSSTIEYLERFNTEVFPSLPRAARPRNNQNLLVSSEVKSKFDAMVKSSGFREDFYEVHTSASQKHPHAVDAACKEPKDRSKRNIDKRLAHERGVADRYFTLMRNLLAQRPDLCPNCLGSHTLSECAVLVKDAWKNPAAFTHSEFEDETGETRSRRQRGYLKCAIRDNAMSSVKS
ncbi:hypothetical protein OXX59_004060 [Metschnikowia pulcherrima]